jgi:hypothetical protein
MRKYDRLLFNEILVKFTHLIGMIADQNFHDICFTCFFILQLWLLPMVEDQSLSGPNNRLQPKVKIAPTVQHCRIAKYMNIFK